MSKFMKLTPEQVNAPRPTRPEWYQPRWVWDYYFVDEACWRATQAEKYLSGIEEPKENEYGGSSSNPKRP